jgi:hypothetical protein
MGKRTLIAALTAVAMFVVAGVASASTFEPSAGTGFVSKGDVQEVFAWNNATFQDNASSVSFTYVASWTWTVVCSGPSGSGTYLQGDGVSGSVEALARTNPKGRVTGFDLLGFASFTGPTGGPVVGEPCGGFANIPVGTVSSVTLNDDRFDALFADFPNLASQIVWLAS